MLALPLGSVLAVLALSYVLWPLLRGAVPLHEQARSDVTEVATAVDALREIEFDQATGKLSDEDYAALRASYTPRALEELRRAEGPAGTATVVDSSSVAAGATMDPAEALIANARSRAVACPSCGPRPEPDALFCSDCGRYLGAACHSCGARDGARAVR